LVSFDEQCSFESESIMSAQQSTVTLLLKKVLSNVFVIWLGMTAIFFAIRLLPGDIVQVQTAGLGLTQETLSAQRKTLNLDQSAIVQYASYVSNWLQGNWGTAWSTGESVWRAITRSVQPTLFITLASMANAFLIGVGWGSLLQIYDGRSISKFLRFVIDILLATPVYWTATLLVLVFAVRTIETRTSILIAILVLSIHTASHVALLTSHAIRNESTSQYVQTAYGKGLSDLKVFFRHILPNTMLVILPFIVAQTSLLIGGTVILESILLIPGVGMLFINAVLNRDYALLQGVATSTLFFVMVFNTIGDSLMTLFVPRIK
jgi:peptide/nickel transport system permease protein